MEQPDWEIGKLYNQAFKIVKEHKVLWLFGMAAGGMSMNFGGNSGSGDFDGLENIIQPPAAPPTVDPAQITQALGASTSANFFEMLSTAIPPSFIIILAIEVLCLIIACVVISLIMNAWANAALLQGIQATLSGQKATIADSSTKAFPSIKPLIWLSVIPMLIIMCLFFIAAVFFMLTIAVEPLRIVFGILGGLSVGAILYAMIFLAMATIWASRIVVFEQKGPRAALAAGYKIAKKKFWAILLLGIVNTILSGVVIGGVLLLIVGLIFGGALGFGVNELVSVGLLGIGVILAFVCIFGFMLLSGILNAFITTVWTIAYNNIKGKYA